MADKTKLKEDKSIDEETPQENLSPSIIYEDNEKVRKVMKILEEWGWHPMIQKEVLLYCKVGVKGGNIISHDKDGKEVNPRNAFRYLHYELSEQLFHYQSATNLAIRNQDYSFSLRKKIIMFLGPKCLFCGSEDIDYLQLDHKSGYGGIERRRFKKMCLSVLNYYWNHLIEAYLRLQVLCIKCHRLKSTYRIFQSEIEEKIAQNDIQKTKAEVVPS